MKQTKHSAYNTGCFVCSNGYYWAAADAANTDAATFNVR